MFVYKFSFKNSVQSWSPLFCRYMFSEKSLPGFIVALFRYRERKAVVKGSSGPSLLQTESICSTKYSYFSFEIMYFLFFLFSITLSCLISGWEKDQSSVISIPYSRCMWCVALGSTTCQASGQQFRGKTCIILGDKACSSTNNLGWQVSFVFI